MSFPPIIERELRVASRRRGTFHARFFVAAAAIALGTAIYFSNANEPQEIVGPQIFNGLAIVGFFYACLAGRLFTADCLSSEKRDGTLGLLFLTDLKGRDVVFGKLAATSLTGFLGLLCLVPVLAIPMMMGGTSNGQFWRVVIVLVNTFLFSLALGVYTSARCRDHRPAMGLFTGLLLGYVICLPGILVLIGVLFEIRGIVWFCPSPATSLALAFDDIYHYSASFPFVIVFWVSVALIHGLAWLLVFRAGSILPHSWQDQPAPALAPAPVSIQPISIAARHDPRCEYRKRLLDINPFYWLVSRQRNKPNFVWLFLMAVTGWWIWVWSMTGHWFELPTILFLTVLANVTLKLWLTSESGQRLAEDQKSGALELLLSTPLTAQDIATGQMLALRRQFLRPFALAAFTELFFAIIAFLISRDENARNVGYFLIFAAVTLPLDALTAGWLGLRLSLTARGPQRVPLTTALVLLLLPWVVFGFSITAIRLFTMFVVGSNQDLELSGAYWVLFGVAKILLDACVGLRSRRDVLTGLRRLATVRFEKMRANPVE